MTPKEIERLKACSQEIAEILYRHTSEHELADLDGIEKSVRRQMLEHVSPEVAFFYRNSNWHDPRKSENGQEPGGFIENSSEAGGTTESQTPDSFEWVTGKGMSAIECKRVISSRRSRH